MGNSSNFKAVDNLWNNSLIGLAYVDKYNKWTRVNPTLCQLLEYSDVELIGSDVASVTHPADIEAEERMLEKLLVNGITFYVTAKRMFTKTGNIIWVKCRVDIVKSDDTKPDYFIIQVAPAHVVAFCPPAQKSTSASLSTPIITDEPEKPTTGFGAILAKLATIIQDIRVVVISVGLSLTLIGKLGLEWINNQNKPETPITKPEKTAQEQLDEIIELIKSNSDRLNELEKNK